MDRNKQIIRTAYVGIGGNAVLATFKAVVGLLSGSIAIVLDAVNNLSDALSSVITVIGIRLAAKPPDKQHPYGHGRVEYVTSVLVAAVVLAAGALSLVEAVTRIITPEKADYTTVTLVIVSAAIVVKLLLGLYFKRRGKKLNADVLSASGTDALFDAVLSAGTLLAAVLSMTLGVSLEGVFGAIISLFILKAGVEMLIKPIGNLIGLRADKNLTVKLKEEINSFPQVKGTYDLTLHNYGPTQIIGSVHVELDDDTTAREIHTLTREIATRIYQKFGILMTIGIYASNNSSEAATEMRRFLTDTAGKFPEVLQVHGFYIDGQNVTFDLVMDFSADAGIADKIVEMMKERYPQYSFYAVSDKDYSD